MSIKNRYADQRRGDPSKITCPHYDPLSGSKRCRNYAQGGACARPDELMCVEWLKRNGPAAEKKKEPGFRLEPQDPPKPEPAPSPSRSVPRMKSNPQESAPLVRNLTDEEVASFKALGASVCLDTEHVGELWIVPEYTGEERREISVEHAATLSALCAAFPGARVKAFEKTMNG